MTEGPARCAGSSAWSDQPSCGAILCSFTQTQHLTTERSRSIGNSQSSGLAARSQWLFGCSRLGHAPRVIAFTHQFKEDSDYVRLIARKKRETGIGMN
jgi:hypothetical protein